MAMTVQGPLRIIKTLESMNAANRYAAACLRRERDPRVRYIPTPRPDGKWDVLRDDRKVI